MGWGLERVTIYKVDGQFSKIQYKEIKSALKLQHIELNSSTALKAHGHSGRHRGGGGGVTGDPLWLHVGWAVCCPAALLGGSAQDRTTALGHICWKQEMSCFSSWRRNLLSFRRWEGAGKFPTCCFLQPFLVVILTQPTDQDTAGWGVQWDTWNSHFWYRLPVCHFRTTCLTGTFLLAMWLGFTSARWD